MGTSGSSRKVRRLVTIAVITALALGIALATARSANAAQMTKWSYISAHGVVWVHSCPSSTCRNIDVLGNGAPVIMICWHDSDWTFGNYWTNRWFYIWYDNREGWVPASYVVNQYPTPHC